jgi:hypothetical protein
MKRLSRLGFVAVLLVWASAAPAAGPASNPATLFEKVVAFCKAHLGKKVENGQCAVLATAALKAVGAKTAFADSPSKGDYVWGKQVYLLEAGRGGPKATGKLNKVKPGFIIQYHDARWPYGTYSHHTSVVAAVDVKAKTLKVYEQNVGKSKQVVEGELELDKIQGGWIRIYRPVPSRK